MNDIKYIVYLMLENRSLDNVLGWLYTNANGDKPSHFIPPPNPKNPIELNYNGLATGSYYNPDGNGNMIPVTQISVNDGQGIPSVDPNEDFKNTQEQIANNMTGFYTNFLKAPTPSQNPAEIMASYTPASLPVLNSLAKSFAVSDAYFCSVPSNTNANRAFSLTGNSIGDDTDIGPNTAMVNTPDRLYPFTFNGPTIWDVLNSKGYSDPSKWMIYYSQLWFSPKYCYTQDMFWASLQNSQNIANYQTLLQGLDGAGPTGWVLPEFSYIEPLWCTEPIGSTNGNDYHPPANLGCGEHFLYELYTALQASPYWENTLLIINFDEHGGTYDHVEPPTNVKAPWFDTKQGTSAPDNYEVPFDFQSLGVRVPLILISPLIEEKTVIRSDTGTPFDHTSVIATILNHFRITKDEWGLGSRVANAPTFENVITLPVNKARTNVTISSPLTEGCTTGAAATAVPANGLQFHITQRALAHEAKKKNIPQEQLNAIYESNFKDVITIKDLNDATTKALEALDRINR